MFVMPDETEATQNTPAGATIPVPDKDDVMAAFRKVAKAPPSPPPDPETGEERHPA